MTVKRKTIGRTFSQSPLSASVDDDTQSFKQTFILSSGKKAVFILKSISANQVETETFVIQETNGRDQTALTPESLKDITRTFKLQQFFPAIGVQVDERIEILDGSRRRAAAIICNAPLNVLVTQAAITAEEARQLANDIQTAKEHNIREIGLQLLNLKQSGMSQKEIADTRGLSQAKVTRALQAASVPQEYVSLFPVQSELSFADFKSLLSVHELITEKGIDHLDLVLNIHDEVENLIQDNILPEDDLKNQIMQVIRAEAADLVKMPKKEKAVVSHLWSFADKDRFARKKNKGRMFSYEFNRLSKELQDELDSAIEHILNKHLTESQ